MAAGLVLRERDIDEVMTRFKRARSSGRGIMDSCRKVFEDTGIPVATVYTLQRRLQPTTELAKDYIRSQAFKLATRVVRKANVDQAMALLSRPNIGVLDPPGEGGVGGGRQFMIGVAMDSLGSVKVGVQIGASARPEVMELDTEPSGEEVPEEDASVGVEAGEVVGEELEEVSPRRRKWYERDPPKKKEVIAPVPLEEGRSPRGIGTSISHRLALAKAERKASIQARVKERNKVSKRAGELAEQLRRAREEG